MNVEKIESLLLRIINKEFPFIRLIDFDNFKANYRVTAIVYIDLNDLANTFPNETVDYDYIEDMNYYIDNPFHAFVDFRDDDLSINDLVETLSRSLGIYVTGVRFYIIP